MVGICDIRRAFGLNGLPSRTDVNKDVVLYHRLFNLLESDTLSYRNKKLDLDVFLPEYNVCLQRPYVWEDCQKKSFVENILLEKPIDGFVVIVHGEVDWANKTTQVNEVIQVVDGKQRLTTLSDFIHNRFPIDVFGKAYYRDFDNNLKTFFASRVNSLTATVYYSDYSEPMDDRTKVLLFNYYNFSGTPQTEEHKNMLSRLVSSGERNI